MTKPTALGFHIYAGGFTLGVRKHFRVLGHLEEGGAWGRAIAKHVESSRRNLPRVPVHVGAEEWPLDEYHGVDFLYGNPPCAPWSAMGPRAFRGSRAWESDPRLSYAKVGFALFDELRPRVWAWESVMGAYRQGRDLVDEFAKRALDLGYDVSYFLHNGMWLGTPQHRERFFFVASNVEMDWRPPSFDPPPTVKAVLADLDGRGDPDYPALGSLPKAFVRWVPQGSPLRSARDAYLALHPEAHVVKTGFAYRKLDAKRVAFGIVGPIYLHPTKARYLTIGEMLAFGGYPIDYEMTGRPGQKAAQIAQAVMPPTARWLARTVARSLRSGKPASASVREIDYRRRPGVTVELGRPKGRSRRWRVRDYVGEDRGKSDGGSSSPAAPRVSGHVVSPPRSSSTPRDKAGAAKRGERGGCGYRIRQLLVEGKNPAEILVVVRREFPWSKARESDVSWNKRKLVDQGGTP